MSVRVSGKQMEIGETFRQRIEDRSSADALPDARLDVRIDGTGDAPRTITLEAVTDAYERYLEAAR